MESESSSTPAEFEVGDYVWYQITIKRHGLPPEAPKVARIKKLLKSGAYVIEFANQTTKTVARTTLSPYTVP